MRPRQVTAELEPVGAVVEHQDGAREARGIGQRVARDADPVLVAAPAIAHRQRFDRAVAIERDRRARVGLEHARELRRIDTLRNAGHGTRILHAGVALRVGRLNALHPPSARSCAVFFFWWRSMRATTSSSTASASKT